MSESDWPDSQQPSNNQPNKYELDKTMTDKPLTEAELVARLAKLPTDIAPDSRLWEAISAQLDAPAAVAGQGTFAELDEQIVVSEGIGTQRAGSSWYEMAAAAAFAAATAAFIVWGQLSTSSPAEALLSRTASFELHEQHGSELIRVRQQLHSELRGSLEELAPATQLVVVENLIRIDEARAEIEDALKEEPGNRLLEQLLLTSYTNELTLLNEFTGLARSAQQRTRL